MLHAEATAAAAAAAQAENASQLQAESSPLLVEAEAAEAGSFETSEAKPEEAVGPSAGAGVAF